jgi:diguanylate cyclase (GGDEF)-like protein
MTSAAQIALRDQGGVESGPRFPSVTPTLGDRVSTLFARTGTLAWLYALVPAPLVTDWIENRALPSSPRGWITEVVSGIVIATLVTMIRRNQLALERLARSDGLTGLYNRRAFEAAVEAECVRARRSNAALTLVYLDIDHFKRINDRFGHAAGDQVLRQVAHAIRASIRSHVDAGFRLGGDEFALLLPASTKAQAVQVVDRIRDCCARHDSFWAVGALDVSAGIVECEADATPGELIRRSDAAMYRQKQSHHRRRAQAA